MPEETFETPQPTQPVTEPKTTNWSKIILVAILGLALLAGAAYAGYYYGTQQVQEPEKPTPVVSQPTTKTTSTPEPTTPVVEDETKDWKTYTNEEYGFSIKYPGEWFVSERHQPVEETTFSRAEEIEAFAPLVVSVRVDKNPSGLSLKQWVDGFFKDYPSSLVHQIRRDPAELGGIEAEKIYVPGEGASWEVVVLHNNRFYSLNIGPIELDGKGKGDMNLGTFDQILSTFKFLD